METREDLDFMFHGMSLFRKCIEYIHTEVVPARLNRDIIENIFCQLYIMEQLQTQHTIRTELALTV